MTQQVYEELKAEVKKTMMAELFKTKKSLVNYEKPIYDYAFDRAYALGMQEKDAEGVSMLTVSRKKAQEMFTEARESIPTCEHDRGFKNAELTILRNLFGSKCLPDKGTDCPPVEVGVAENTTITQPQPSEPSDTCTETCKETCKDNCTSPDHFVVKDEMVDNNINDGFSEHNRLHIASMAMAGLLANPTVNDYTALQDAAHIDFIVEDAVTYADALIDKCGEGDSREA